MRRLASAALVLLAAAACRKQPEPATPAAAAPAAFTLRDVAAAAALDARLAALTWQGSRCLDLLGRGDRAGAQALAGGLSTALAEAEQAAAAVAHPLDRTASAGVVAGARGFVQALAAFTAAVAADPRASPAALIQARDELGRAVNAYRQSRTAWRVEAPLEVGAAQDFAEAKQALERAEMQGLQLAAVAPRDEGHRLDAGSARLGAQTAAVRARDAAARLDPALRLAAARWVDAQERSLQALTALGAAPAAEQPRLSLGYQAARAEALAALADYARLKADGAAR